MVKVGNVDLEAQQSWGEVRLNRHPLALPASARESRLLPRRTVSDTAAWGSRESGDDGRKAPGAWALNRTVLLQCDERNESPQRQAHVLTP